MMTNKNEYIAEQNDTLLSYLIGVQSDLSRNKIKSKLTHRQVYINGTVTTQFDAPIGVGDKIWVMKGKGAIEFRHPMMRVVYEDDAIVVIDKRSGLLSVGTDKERTRTAFFLLSEHVKRSDPKNLIFVIHRLDRETSGLMMYAKSEKVQQTMQREWDKMVTERKYVAVTEGVLPSEEGVIDVALTENKSFKVYADATGERAITTYRRLDAGANYSLLELTLETGKKNQIRAHLEHLNTPIAGDKKYSAQTNPAKRVCLHAYILNIIHPITGEAMQFSTPIPPVFEMIVRKDGNLPPMRPPYLRAKRSK